MGETLSDVMVAAPPVPFVSIYSFSISRSIVSAADRKSSLAGEVSAVMLDDMLLI